MKKLVLFIAFASLTVSCSKDKATAPAPDRCLSMQPYEESTNETLYIDGSGDVYSLEGSIYTHVDNSDKVLDCTHVELPPEVLIQPEPAPDEGPYVEPNPPVNPNPPVEPNPPVNPEEPTACIDTDGDGWGWDGYRSCRLDGPVPVGPCVDSDGDGWGWNGQSSCRTTHPLPVGECIDEDGDGWGWDGQNSCRIHTTTCQDDGYGSCDY